MYLKRRLELELKYKTRTKVYRFTEPTLYVLEEVQELIEEKKYYEAIKLILDIDYNDFVSNPLGILKTVFRLINGDEKGNGDVFIPAVYDIVCKRYGLHPVEFLKQTTPSMLKTILEGIEYNINIETDNEKENRKYEEKKYTEEEIKDKMDLIKNLEFKTK